MVFEYVVVMSLRVRLFFFVENCRFDGVFILLFFNVKVSRYEMGLFLGLCRFFSGFKSRL